MKVNDEKSRIRIQRHGSADPDPHQNVMDPEHWFLFTLRDVVGGGVHLDNLHILIGHLGAQLVIDGGQLLAVPAPRRVELNQHVLGSRRNTTTSVAGPGCLSRILIFTHSGSRIQKQ
jgi:hypothetical protein